MLLDIYFFSSNAKQSWCSSIGYARTHARVLKHNMHAFQHFGDYKTSRIKKKKMLFCLTLINV